MNKSKRQETDAIQGAAMQLDDENDNSYDDDHYKEKTEQTFSMEIDKEVPLNATQSRTVEQAVQTDPASLFCLSCKAKKRKIESLQRMS